MIENKRVKNRRDIAANWTANNPVLLAGEFGIELDSTPIKMKIGDGATHWNDLPYAGASESEIIEIIEETTYTKQQIDTALDGKADADDVYTKTEVDNIKSEIEGEIPTVNDSTVNIYQGGTLKGSFTLNQSSGETINLDAGGVSSVDWDDITDKPDFASVATSGEYSDLNHRPEIPVKTSDLTNDSGFVTSSDLARVASTGEYTDLLHRPEIPTVGDGTITIKQGNVTKGTFTTNQSGDTTIIIDEGGQFTQQQSDWTEADTTSPAYIQHKPTIPTATSDLTNDSGFVTSSDVPTATSDLTNDSGFITLNDVPAQVNADWNSSTGASQILNKPTIPTKTSDLQNDSGFTTFSGDYNDLSNKPQIPANTSDLTNDSGFITSADVPGAQVQADWTEADSTSPAYIANKPSIPSGQVQSDWNQSDSAQVDYIKNKPTIPAAQVNSDWNANSGVAQILNKPTIPTKTSDLTNDSGFVTSSDVPTATSDLTNDSGFITLSDVPAQAQADWTEADPASPSYIQHKPSIPSGQQQSDWNQSDSTQVDFIKNKPTIPTKTSDLTNDSGFVTSSDVPTATSDLTNDSGFITLNDVPAQAQADWAEVDSTDPSYIQHKPTVYTEWFGTQAQYDAILVKDSNTIYHIEGPAPEQSDWNVNDNTSMAYIKNKPTIPAAQVNSDWNANSGVAQILNKPTIPTATSDLTNDSGFVTSSDVPTATSDLTNDSGFITSSDIPAQVQSDWNEADSTSPAYIANKPSIPSGQVQSDWNQSDNTAVDYIKNKPSIPTVNNNTITLTQGGVTKGSFTLNQSSDTTIALDAGGGGGSTEFLPVNRITNYTKLQNGYMYFVIKDGYNNYIELSGLNITSTTQANTVSVYFLMEMSESYPFHNCLITFEKINTTIYHVEDYYFMFGLGAYPSQTETIDGVTYRYVGWTTDRGSMDYFPQTGGGSVPAYYGTFAPKGLYLGNITLYSNSWETTGNDANVWKVQFNSFYSVLDNNGWFIEYKNKFVPPASDSVDGIIEHPNVSPENLSYRKIGYTDPDSSTAVTDFMTSYPYAGKINTTPLTITNTSSHDITFGVINSIVNNSQNDTYSMLVKKMHIYGAYDDEWGSTQTGWLPDSVYTYNTTMYKWAITLKAGESYKFYFDCFLNKQDDGMGYVSYVVIAPSFGVTNDSDLSYITVSGNIMSLFYGMEFTGYETNVPEWILDYDRDNQYAIQTQNMYYWLSVLTTYSNFSLNYVNDYQPNKTTGYNFPSFFSSISTSSYSARRTAICNALYENTAYSGQTALPIPTNSETWTFTVDDGQGGTTTVTKTICLV